MNKIIFKLKQVPTSICVRTGQLSVEEEMIECQIVQQENNLIQFIPYVSPEKIYLEQHNNSVGRTWMEHNEAFSNLIKKYETKNITEIGGGSGNIFSKFSDFDAWTVIDLNPYDVYNDVRVNKIQNLYDPNFINKNDVVISSHVIEHMFYVEDFLTSLRNRNPKYHIFSMPNMEGYARSNYSATIFVEHPNYLPEVVMDSLLVRNGWEIVEKNFFKEHSIFYVTKPSQEYVTTNLPDKSEDIIKLISYLKKRAQQVKDKKFYVFGAHLTYYYLLNMGISEDQILGVVDNDWKKCGKRMYGHNTKVLHTSELLPGSNIFLEMGPYNEEIKESLKDMELI